MKERPARPVAVIVWFVALALVGFVPATVFNRRAVTSPASRASTSIARATVTTLSDRGNAASPPTTALSAATRQASSLAPSGLFAWSGAGGSIVVSRYDGSGRRVIATPTPNTALEFSWSPSHDSLMIDEVPNVSRSEVARASSFELFDVASGRTRVLVAPGAERFDRDWAWAPSGDAIAVSSATSPTTGATQLETLDVTTGTRRAIASVSLPRSPEWSPKGGKIAFLSGMSPTVLDVVDIATRHVVQVASAVDAPSWSADGRRLVYAKEFTTTTGQKWAHVVNADGSADTALADPQESYQNTYDFDPRWSPDGRYVALVREYDSQPPSCPTTTIVPQRCTPPSTPDDITAVVDVASNTWWRSQSSSVAFRGQDNWSKDSAAVMVQQSDHDGLWSFARNTVEVTTDALADKAAGAAWSPDQGFVASQRDNREVEVRSVPHSEVVLNLGTDVQSGLAGWSPDSSAIVVFVAPDGWGVYRVDGRAHWSFSR